MVVLNRYHNLLNLVNLQLLLIEHTNLVRELLRQLNFSYELYGLNTVIHRVSDEMLHCPATAIVFDDVTYTVTRTMLEQCDTEH